MAPTITESTGAAHTRLLSVAGYRGSRVVDNEEMCTMIDSSDEWIRQRTGIAERRWSTDEETPLYMAVQAGRQAIERAGLTAADIDGVLVATVSHHMPSPSLAVSVCRELGIGDAAAMDVSAACAGFCYLIETASSLVRAGSAHNVLIIGVEKLSSMINIEDRSTAFLFADGAGAAVVGASDTPGIGPAVWGSDGEQSDVIEIQDWRDVPAGQPMPFITMEGNKVFKWATTVIAKKAREAIDRAGLAPEDIDVFIPHQANNRITDSMVRHLKLPESVTICRDIVHMGNASAASIPIAMNAMIESGQATSGQLALIIGFGAGLVYAGQVVTIP